MELFLDKRFLPERPAGNRVNDTISGIYHRGLIRGFGAVVNMLIIFLSDLLQEGWLFFRGFRKPIEILKNCKIRSIRAMGDPILNCALFECIRGCWEKQAVV